MKQAAVLSVLCLALLSPAVQAAPVLTVKYVGDINAAKAYATVTYEKVFEYVVMAGRIESGQYVYTFNADIYGTAGGYGQMTDHYTRSRFVVRVQFTQDGFAVTPNPFGPGAPSTYYFKKT